MTLDISQNNGSLLYNSTDIVSAFDLMNSPVDCGVTRLKKRYVLNRTHESFEINYNSQKKLTIINGMGVTLGDSIVGISALHYIKNLNQKTSIRLIRPRNCHTYVEDIYKEAKNIISEIHYMPYSLKKISPNEINIDIGNQVFWRDFDELEMHDFFFKNIGINPTSVDEAWKKNTWLQKEIPRNKSEKYVLFCPYSSTKLRSIPDKYHYKIIDELYKKHKVSVFGFCNSAHPKYHNVASKCLTTRQYIEMIANSSYVYTCDSSALHIAAGYNIPTFCVFTSIEPGLRARYYSNCSAVYIGDSTVQGLHDTNEESIIRHVETNFEKFYEKI
ncbi:hypothetical protein QO199_25165 [Serratia bockelmannii]|uniref:ADP-heptose:LPS heptosyltransferase n=1 Tax=Serratia bockelmannii TaxID=2703793 RepID=A0ABT8LX96_9GAMM|nr:hypothetical protein [Serratia bockelmannii]MDN6881933.1 hypothetical protein [Serratia bockelmannii]HBH6890282.1 hypothetical protein [Serratia marcescens]